jgi:hypothetical protein
MLAILSWGALFPSETRFDENLAKNEDLAKKLRDKRAFNDYAMRRGSWDSSNWGPK